MSHHHRPTTSAVAALLTLAWTRPKQAAAVVTMILIAVTCFAQDEPQTTTPDSQTSTQASAGAEVSTVTIPAGTRIALVLTHPIQSRYVHRGDDVYAQITSPIASGNQVVIPPGTLVQGKVDKLAHKGGRGEVYLQSMSAMFPDGYVVPISGPATLETDDGYALKDPGKRRMVSAFALPAAGLGLGALIGHSVASSQPVTITNTLPPGCTGPPPGCLSSSVTGPPDRLKSTAIGSMVGLAAGGVASLALIMNSHNFFLDVGSPVVMVLQRPITLQQDEVADAVRQSEQHPAPQYPMAPRPEPPPPPNTGHGTCYTPGTPGTPPTIIPGTPPIGDSPSTPDTIIPGTPAIPGTPYPCP
ncbi:MAG: TrbI/VirB10 family protein [Acidobacteriia bacterium]|nr:TrbI/VirB10 family protein [Terriglobia bacterium]